MAATGFQNGVGGRIMDITLFSDQLLDFSTIPPENKKIKNIKKRYSNKS